MARPMTKTLISCFSFMMLATTHVYAGIWIDNEGHTQKSSTTVIKDDTITMRTEKPFTQIRVANSEIVDVAVVTDKSFHLMGKQGGKTNIMLYDEENRLVDIVKVTVGFDLVGLKKSLFETFPNENIEVRPMASGIYMSGSVSDQDMIEKAEQIAQAYAPDRVTNGLSINDSHQVMLDVRFVEASRDCLLYTSDAADD